MPNALPPFVIKISGHELDDPATLAGLAAALHRLDHPVIVVHGGGKEISDLQTRLGIEPRYIDGQRVTDAASLAVVEMVLCGSINKRIVRTLIAAGVDALGISGVDRGLIRAGKLPHPTVDMGYTGIVETVRGDILLGLLDAAVTPVIAPVCLGEGHNYNVNADLVAGAVAGAVGAARLIFLSNVPGVLREGAVIARLTPDETEALITGGVIAGGMIPKVRTALAALDQGVSRVMITNLAGLHNDGGTLFER